MSHYRIRYDGGCHNFFNSSRAFACATGSHHGVSVDVFQQFNEHWLTIKKKYKLIH
jgi:hypothetical protein